MAAIKKLLKEHTKSEQSLQDLYNKSSFSDNASYQAAYETPSIEISPTFQSILDAHTNSERKMDEIYAARNPRGTEYRVNPVSYYADPLRKEVNSYLETVNRFSGYSPATMAALKDTAQEQLAGYRAGQGFQDMVGTNLRKSGEELANKIKENKGIDERTRTSLLRSLSAGTGYLDDVKLNNIAAQNGSNLIPDYTKPVLSGTTTEGHHGGGASFAPDALTKQETTNSAANERLNQAAEDLNYKVDPGQMPTNERLQRISEIQRELQGLRAFEDIQPGSMRGADTATVQRAIDAQSRIKSLNEELDALQSGYSYRPSEYSRLADAATEAQKNINAYMADSQTRNRITTQQTEGQNLLENAKILANEGRIKEALDYYNQYNNQQAKTKFGANYTSGRIGQDESLAWNEYLNHPTDANRRYAETLSELSEQYQTNNAEMMKKNDSIASLITEDLARYVPQFVDQMKYEALPMLFGAVAGGERGMKIGRLIGAAAYSWETMSGAAFKNLLDRGVDEETARTACRNEAFLSTIIECADEVVDMFTTGFGKVSSQLFGTPVRGFDAVLKKFVGNSTWKKWLVRLGKFGLNVGSEANEEGSQEAISIANERMMAKGKDVSLTELAIEAIKIYIDAIFNPDSENRERIGEAAAGGARLALVNAPMESAGNAALSSGINQMSGRQIRTSGAMQDVINEGFYNNQDSRAYQLAQELQNMQNQPAGNRLQEIARQMVADNRLGQLSAENNFAAAADAEANQLVYSAADKAMAGQEITNNEVAAILENDLAVEELEQASGQEISTLRRGERPNAVRSALNTVAESIETAADIDQNRSMKPYSAVTGRTGENTNLSLNPSLNKIAMSEQGRQVNAGLRTEANPTLSAISASMAERKAMQSRQEKQESYWKDVEERKENIRKRIEENRQVSPEAWDNDLERMYDESNPNWSNKQLMDYSENLGMHGAGAYVSSWNSNQNIAQYTKEFTQYYNAGMNGQNIDTVGDISTQVLTQPQREQAYITGIRDMRTGAVKEAVNEFENENRTESARQDTGRNSGVGTNEQGRGRQFWKDAAQRRSREQQKFAERIRKEVDEQGLKKVSAKSLGIPNGTSNESMTIIPEGSSLYSDEMRKIANRMKAMGTEVRYFVGRMEVESVNSEGKRVTFPVNGTIMDDGRLMYVQVDNTDKFVNLDFKQIAKHEEFHKLKKLYPQIENEVKAKVNELYDPAQLRDLQTQYYIYYGYMKDESLEEIYADAYAGIDRIAPYLNEYASTTEYMDVAQNIGKEYADRALREQQESVQEAENVGDKFSLNAPIERTKDFVAVHNKYMSAILEAVKLGGFPSPSIAIIDSSQGHSKYGDVSVVFKREAIDPALDKRNKVYGADAWTPTNDDVTVEYKVDDKALRNIEKRFSELSSKVAEGEFQSDSVLRGLGIDSITRFDPEEIADRLVMYDSVKAAYLADKGIDIPVRYKDHVYDRHVDNDILGELIDHFGQKKLEQMVSDIDAGKLKKEDKIDFLEQWKKAERTKPFYDKIAAERGEERVTKRINEKAEKIGDLWIDDIISHALEMANERGAIRLEIDKAPMIEELDKLVSDDQDGSYYDRKKFKTWIRNEINGLIEKPGIYNGSEVYTRSGNRKPFSQTHWDYTAENIVRAMQQASARGQGFWGMGAEGMQAVASTDFKSIEEMHSEEDRLYLEDEETHRERYRDIDDQINSIYNEVERINKAHTDNTFDERELVGNILMRAAQGKRTAAAVKSAFQKEGYRINDQIANQIIKMYNDAASMPTGYFEAKPQRVVNFNEVAMVLVPDDSKETDMQKILDAGMRVVTYEAGDEADRIAKLNSDASVKFSRETNPVTLKWLDEQDTVKVYRAMQVIDGKLYPPMAAKVSGKLVEPTEFGKWYVADESNREENPERFIKKKRKDGTIYYNFRLNKANGKEIDAAYNPYWHTSKSLLNDQFSSAYNRPNLVTVECEVPVSELTSGYRAEGAKDPVGIVHWHTGPVSSKLAEVGKERIVILSRYVKVNRIVSDAEAAQSIKEMLEGTSITIPENTVTPSLKKELEAVGVTITPPKITIKALKDFSPKDSYIRSDDYKKTLKAFQGAWKKLDKLSDRISDLKKQIEAESELKDRADWTEEDEYDSYMGRRPRTYTKVGKRLQKKLDGLEEQRRSLLHQRDELSDKLQEIKADARREEFKTFDAPKKATRTDYEGFRLDNTSNSFGNDYLTNGKGYIAEMTPQEYIERCAFEIFDTGTIESTINGTDPELVQKYADMMMDGTKFDLPYLNYKDGGQEGRHRALAAYQAEIDTIPVLIIGEHRNGVLENEIELDLDSDDIDIEDLLDDVNVKELLDEQDEVDNIIADRKVENGEGLTPSEEVRYSLNHDADFVEKERAFKQNFVRNNVLTESFAQREFVRNKLMQPGIRELLPEDKMGKTSFGNGSYGRSMEHSTICPRTLSMEAILDGLSERFGRPITVDESIKISQLAWAYMDAPECAYCYVAMDRKAKREYLLNYLTSRNEVFKNLDSGMSREDAYNVFLNGRKDTKPMKDRFNNWIRMRENGSEMIEMKDLASDRAIKAASEKSKSMADQVKDALKYAQSASWAKKYVQYTAYNGEILKWNQKLVNSLNRMYGMRMYSFSDFHPAFTLEDMQMITDASLRGLKVLAYTKEIDFARIMEPTGANINVSVFAQSTKDTKGDYGMDAMQGADWEEAKALRAESIKNGTGVGITMVCTNDDQIEWALNQDWIDVVIPFHMVKTGDVVRKSFGWDNYTDMQGDKKLKDLWDGKVNEAMIEPPEHQNNKRLYLEALKRNNLTPRFERWIDNPNYMKLVNETRRAEGETPTVQPKFNLDAADEMFNKMQKQGGYYQHLGLETDVFEDLQDEIYDEYVEKYGAPTKYSRNSRISPDAQREISQQKMDLEQKLMAMNDALKLAQKENERLQKELTKAQREMTITKEKKALEGSVKYAATSLMKEYDIYPGDKGKYAELHYQISKNLEQMRNVVLNITDPEVYEKNLRLYALKMTDDMIKGMQRLVSADEQTYSSMKEYLKATKIRLSEQDKPDMKDFDKFRKRNMGRMRLTNDGLPVDTVYQEMREEFGENYFPEDITHPADQLYRIEEIMQTLEPVYEGYTSLEMAEMKEYIASDIENRIIDIVTSNAIKSAPPTLADKMKAQYEAKLQSVESGYQKRLEEMSAANLEKINKILDKEKDSRSEMNERISSYYSEQNAARRARRADSDARTRLLNIARRLSNKKLPTPNKALIQQYIADLDLVAKSMTRTTFDKLSDLKMWYDTEKATNPDFISDPQTEAKLRRLSQWRISELSIDEVKKLTEILLNIENEIRTQRYLIEAADKRDIYIQGEETIRNISNTEGIKAGALGKLDSLFVNGTLSPVRAMHRMTGYNEDDPLYRATKELADGQRKMFDFRMRADRMFSTWTEDKAFVREISGKNAKLIEVLPGVVITPDMRMSLYLHSKNDENLRHVAKGGVTIPDMKLYKKGDIAEAYNRGRTVKLQRSQVEAIIKGMSEKEKAFADQASKYFGEMSQKAINETSELLKGYSLAEVKNYFPINTDRNFTRADFESLKMDGTIEGMGFLKERVQASNPIYLRDMSDVLRQSIEMTGKYVGLAIPVRNFNKIWNVATGEKNAEGKFTSFFDGSVKQEISQKWGEPGLKYIENMMTDLQNGKKSVSDWSKVLGKVRSHYAQAVLTLNASVAMKQAASYPTAGAVLGWKPLLRALADFGPVNTEKINKYTPLLWYRTQGFSTQELGDMKQRGMKLPKALNWVQGMDVLTTRKLWKASEYYVKSNNKDLKVGSEEYYKAVADIYNRVIEETQPNYTTMQRPQLLRQDDTLLSAMMMFKTQPFQNFNILYDAIGNLAAKEQQYKQNTNAKTEAAVKQARRDAANAITSQVAQLAVFAGMTFAWAMFRGKGDKYKDEEGNQTFLTTAAGIGKDMIGNLFSSIPFGADAWEYISSKIFGDKYYGFDIATASSIDDLLNAFTKAGDAVKEIFGAMTSDDKKLSDVDWNEQRLNMTNVLYAVGKIAGVPAENVGKLFEAIFRNSAHLVAGKYDGEYAYLRLTESETKHKADYMNLLWKAYKNDPEAYKRLYEKMINLDGLNEAKIKSAMEAKMKKDQGAESVSDLEQRFMAPDVESEYGSMLQPIKDSKLWGQNEKADEKLENKLYQIATGTEAGMKIQQKMDEYSNEGIDNTTYLLYQLALDIADGQGDGNGSYNNEEKEAAIRMLGLPKKKSYDLWEAQSNAKTDKNNPWK